MHRAKPLGIIACDPNNPIRPRHASQKLVALQVHPVELPIPGIRAPGLGRVQELVLEPRGKNSEIFLLLWPR